MGDCMRLGVDVGGTFTDLLLHDDVGQRTYQAKTPSTPDDQSIGVAAGVKLICEKAGISPGDITLVLHGTTVATNAVLEGKGARVGLLVTAGFEYTLHLAKSWTPGPLFGWIVMDKPDPLASLGDTRGVPERVGADGNVVLPLDGAAAITAIDDLCSSGIEALDDFAACIPMQTTSTNAGSNRSWPSASQTCRCRSRRKSFPNSGNTTGRSPRS